MTTPVTEALTVTPARAVLNALWPLLGGNHTEAELWNEIAEAVEKALTHTTPTEPVLRWEGWWLKLGDATIGRVAEGLGERPWWTTNFSASHNPAATLPEAKTAAEQAVRDWLARAGVV